MDWLWPVIVGAIVTILIGLIAAVRSADRERISKLEQWTKDKEKFDHTFRHDEYAKAIANINTKLWPLGTHVDTLEKRVERIEAKMNGYLKRNE